MIKSLGKTLPVIAGVICFTALDSQAEIEQRVWTCPEADYILSSLIDDDWYAWQIFSLGDAARVQRLHPNTQITAHAKFLPSINGRSAAICQYYNYVGVIVTLGGFDLTKIEEPDAPYFWRSDFTESYEEQDVKGREYTEVCMQEADGIASPSIACKFAMPPAPK